MNHQDQLVQVVNKKSHNNTQEINLLKDILLNENTTDNPKIISLFAEKVKNLIDSFGSDASQNEKQGACVNELIETLCQMKNKELRECYLVYCLFLFMGEWSHMVHLKKQQIDWVKRMAQLFDEKNSCLKWLFLSFCCQIDGNEMEDTFDIELSAAYIPNVILLCKDEVSVVVFFCVFFVWWHYKS